MTESIWRVGTAVHIAHDVPRPLCADSASAETGVPTVFDATMKYRYRASSACRGTVDVLSHDGSCEMRSVGSILSGSNFGRERRSDR